MRYFRHRASHLEHTRQHAAALFLSNRPSSRLPFKVIIAMSLSLVQCFFCFSLCCCCLQVLGSPRGTLIWLGCCKWLHCTIVSLYLPRLFFHNWRWLVWRVGFAQCVLIYIIPIVSTNSCSLSYLLVNKDCILAIVHEQINWLACAFFDMKVFLRLHVLVTISELLAWLVCFS